MHRLKRFDYGLSEKEVDSFIEKNSCLKEFLNQYTNDSTHTEKSVGLCRFFSWLKIVKKIDITPVQFLNMHIQKRKLDDIEERRWALKLALDYSRDNPDLTKQAISYRYTAFYLPVKMFCDYHEAPLTSTKELFKNRSRRKYKDTLTTVTFIKKALAAQNQRNKTVSLVQLQSGQAIQQVLIDINLQCKRIFREIDAGKQRIKFDFDERKGNGFAYFSFISRDAIQEIQKWRPIRQKILNELGIESDYLFITEKGKPLSCKDYHTYSRKCYIKSGLYTGSHSVRSHGYRKFFEQEASPPDRGISKSYITFMMGHSEGDGQNHPLDAVGGTYDKAPHVYPEVVEREYEKLEPYINIYSGKATDNLKAEKEIDELHTQIGELKKETEDFREIVKVIMNDPKKLKIMERWIIEPPKIKQTQKKSK